MLNVDDDDISSFNSDFNSNFFFNLVNLLLGHLGLKQILDKEINRLKVLEGNNSSMNKDIQTREPVQRSE